MLRDLRGLSIVKFEHFGQLKKSRKFGGGGESVNQHGVGPSDDERERPRPIDRSEEFGC